MACRPMPSPRRASAIRICWSRPARAFVSRKTGASRSSSDDLLPARLVLRFRANREIERQVEQTLIRRLEWRPVEIVLPNLNIGARRQRLIPDHLLNEL